MPAEGPRPYISTRGLCLPGELGALHRAVREERGWQESEVSLRGEGGHQGPGWSFEPAIAARVLKIWCKGKFSSFRTNQDSMHSNTTKTKRTLLWISSVYFIREI